MGAGQAAARPRKAKCQRKGNVYHLCAIKLWVRNTALSSEKRYNTWQDAIKAITVCATGVARMTETLRCFGSRTAGFGGRSLQIARLTTKPLGRSPQAQKPIKTRASDSPSRTLAHSQSLRNCGRGRNSRVKSSPLLLCRCGGQRVPPYSSPRSPASTMSVVKIFETVEHLK